MRSSIAGGPFWKSFWVLLWLSGGLLLITKAQNELSLRAMIDQALQENYQIRIFKNLSLQAENRNTVGNAGMLPEVMVTAERSTSINNSQQQFFTGDTQQATGASRLSTSASLETNWIVFDGMAMFARKDQLEQLSQLSQAETRFYIEQTVADLATAYYQLRQERQLLTALSKSLEVSRARLTFAGQAFDIGTNTQLDVQLAQVDLNTDSALVLRQEARILELQVAMNRLIRRDLTLPVYPKDSLILDDSLHLSVLLEAARNQNSSLDQQELKELIAFSESKINQGALFPEIELFGSYDFNRQANEIGFLQSSRTFGPQYGIRVRFNLFSGRREQIVHENALIHVETEKLRSQDLLLEVEQAVRVSYLRWLSRLREVELESQSVQAAAVAMQIAQGQYALGALTNLEFRQIQLNAVQAQTRFLQAQFEAKRREIELLRLSGSLLEGVL